MFGYPMKSCQQYYSDFPSNDRIWYLLMNGRMECIYDLVMSMGEITGPWKNIITTIGVQKWKITLNKWICPTTLSVFLGEVMEPITNELSNLDGHTLSHTDKDIQEHSQSTYKLLIEVVYKLRGTKGTTCILGEIYQRIFQPNPFIKYQGILSEQLDNSWLSLIVSRIHVPSGNFQANYLALNSVQYNMLQSHMCRVDSHFHLTYILPTQLPHVTAEADERRIILPTVELPNNAHAITSPVPFALFTRFGKYGCPFLPAYSNHLNTTLSNVNPTTTPEPIYTDASLPFPLMLLADA